MDFIKYEIADNVIALTTTVSLGNTAFQIGNDSIDVKNNRKKILKELNIDSKHLIYVHQSHSDVIKKVTLDDLGRGEVCFETGVEADALYTNLSNIALGIFHADCVPIFFYDTINGIIGIIHAGYIGTLKEICKKSINYVLAKESLDIKNFKFVIGPSLGKEFYNIDEDDVITIKKLGYEKALENKKVDVKLINIMQILSLGAKMDQISVSTLDTGEDDNLFLAYKNNPIGRMSSIIMSIKK